MDRKQRFRYEMFLRVRDFGVAHAGLFPESSTGEAMFGQVTAAVAAIDEHLKNGVLGAAGARRVKPATRKAVFGYMKTIALLGRRVTRPETGQNPFRMPRGRSLTAELAAARAFVEEAEKRQDEFVRFGLPPTFVSDFRTEVEELQHAVNARLNSKTIRKEAAAGIRTTLAEGLEVIRDLDAAVAAATRTNPIVFAAWEAARRIEGLGKSSSHAAAAAAAGSGTEVSVSSPAVPAAAEGVPVDSPAAKEPAAADAAPAPALQDVLGRAS